MQGKPESKCIYILRVSTLKYMFFEWTTPSDLEEEERCSLGPDFPSCPTGVDGPEPRGITWLDTLCPAPFTSHVLYSPAALPKWIKTVPLWKKMATK